MKRKIVRQGGDSLTVSLPIKWVREQGLKAGQELKVIERGSSLVMQSPKSHPEEVEISVDDNLENMKSQLISFYIAGVDKIKINFNQPYVNDNIPIEKAVKNVISKYLHGMRIDDRDDNYYVLTGYFETNPDSLNKALRNCLKIVLESSTRCSEILQKNDERVLSKIIELNEDVKQFCFYALRLLHKNAPVDFNHAIALKGVIKDISEISNLLRHMAKHYSGTKRKKEVINAVEKVGELLEAMYNAYYNMANVNEFFTKSQELRDNLNQSTVEKEIKENIFMIKHLATDLVRQSLIINFKNKPSC